MNINHSGLAVDSTNSFQVMACRNTHVLLVEHESRDHDNIINLLNYFSYKVTSVKLLSTALSILSKGKVQYDLIMVNMNPADSLDLGHQLLEDATKMKLLVIFLSNVDDVSASMRALEAGAFLCIRKPLSMAIVGSLWQLVLSEKARRSKLIDNINHNNFQEKQFQKYILKNNQKYFNLEEEEEEAEEKETTSNSSAKSETYSGHKQKVWTEWTLDLHSKFMAAAKFLGQGKCYPKEILEKMNVPGLTRMQVASHLQKCRNAKWLPPNERKLKGKNRGKKGHRSRTLRFGLMPFWEEKEKEPEKYFHDDQFNEAIQVYAISSDDEDHHHHHHHQEITPTHHVFGHDDDDEISSNITPLFDILAGFEFESTDNMGQQFNDYNLPDQDDPFQLLPIMDSQMVHETHFLQQDLGMDLDDNWESFLLHHGGDNHNHNQKVADATKQCFQDAINPEMEINEAADQPVIDEGGFKV